MKERNINILLALGSLVFTLVLAECLVRVLWLPKQVTPARIACEYDSLLGWKKIAGRSFDIRTSEYALRESINSKGLRGPEYGYERNTPSFRLLSLGDSFVEGYSVPDTSLFTTLLEDMLRSRSFSEVEVINMGTGGYSTDQEYLAYRSEGRKYHSDLVLLFFYYNDLLYNVSPSYDGYPKPYFVETDGKFVLANAPVPEFGPYGRLRTRLKSVALLKLLKSFENQLLHKSSINNSNSETDCFLPKPPPWVENAWKVTEQILLMLNEAIKEDGSKLIVLYVPARFEVVAEMRSKEYIRQLDVNLVNARLKTICLRGGIEFIDLKDAFKQSLHQESFYYAVDGHWNQRGHYQVAQFLSPLLLSYTQGSQQRSKCIAHAEEQ
jgi:GDSL-like Lipase/Acylhydrolase family